MKLFLYVFIATLTTFLGQFSVQVIDKGLENLYQVPDIAWVVMVLSSVLAGAIAWQAKLSDSPEQEEKQIAVINTLKGLRNEVRNK